MLDKIIKFGTKLFSAIFATGTIGLVTWGSLYIAKSVGWWAVWVGVIVFTITGYIDKE